MILHVCVVVILQSHELAHIQFCANPSKQAEEGRVNPPTVFLSAPLIPFPDAARSADNLCACGPVRVDVCVCGCGSFTHTHTHTQRDSAWKQTAGVAARLGDPGVSADLKREKKTLKRKKHKLVCAVQADLFSVVRLAKMDFHTLAPVIFAISRWEVILSYV